jgi:dTDP-4-amino-4,6-dideoxygalactose transaminase
VACAVVFANARGALAAAIVALAPSGLVAVPAYTCVAVPDAVTRARGELVYADVDGRGLVPAGGWPASDVALVQDTYGFVSELPDDRHVVCDSTHRADLVLRGGRGAVRVTSFEHSKTLSAGQGGLAVTDDPDLARRMREWGMGRRPWLDRARMAP